MHNEVAGLKNKTSQIPKIKSGLYYIHQNVILKFHFNRISETKDNAV